nr:ribonuclease H-like domain-containing protein [Tanacetum cinerariifolium]
MDLKWQMAMLSVRVHKFEQKAGRKIDFDKKESARFKKKKARCYKCQQRGHFARECRAKGGNDKQRYSSFKIKEIAKKEEDSKALITVDTLVDWTDHDGESDGVVASKEFGMIASCDTEDAIEEGAAKIYNLITGADTEEASTAGDAGEFALMGVTYEEHKKPQLILQETVPIDTSGDEVDDSPLNSSDEIFQKELARLKGQEQRATSDAESLGLGFANDAEELQKRASDYAYACLDGSMAWISKDFKDSVYFQIR